MGRGAAPEPRALGAPWKDRPALAIALEPPAGAAGETSAKLPFYAAHHVDEVVIVDPQAREVTWLGSAGGSYEPLAVSGLIDLGPDELAHRIAWP